MDNAVMTQRRLCLRAYYGKEGRIEHQTQGVAPLTRVMISLLTGTAKVDAVETVNEAAYILPSVVEPYWSRLQSYAESATAHERLQ